MSHQSPKNIQAGTYILPQIIKVENLKQKKDKLYTILILGTSRIQKILEVSPGYGRQYLS